MLFSWVVTIYTYIYIHIHVCKLFQVYLCLSVYIDTFVSIYTCRLLCMKDVIFMNEKHGPVGCDDLLFRFFRFRTDVSSWIVSDSSHVV